MSSSIANDPGQIVRQAQDLGVAQVQLQYTDVLGVLKSVSLPLDRLQAALEHGCWFDGSSLDAFTRTAESDLYLRPDPATFSVLPWAERAQARLICAVVDARGEPYPGDPRARLVRVVEAAASAGYRMNIGPEVEFYLLRPGVDGAVMTDGGDKAGYFDSATAGGAAVFSAIVAAAESCGCRLQSGHHEVAPGQYEIDLAPAGPVETADALITVRQAAKLVASAHGYIASFMPKPLNNHAGSGLHLHQSVHGVASQQNLFAGADDYGLSDIGKAFLAGQLHHAAGMSLVLAPVVNSYKRLVRGFEAPIFISWARTNRGALLRVPEVSEAGQTRIELRSPDGTCNPYLALAVMLHCGLDGIEKGLALPAPVEEALYELDDQELQRRDVRVLPDNLKEAIVAFEHDLVVQDALGPYLSERLLAAKRQEWNDYRGQVTPWEVDRYL